MRGATRPHRPGRTRPGLSTLRVRIAVGDPLDVPLEDSDLLEEVQLVAALMVAAGESDGPLLEEQIDEVLGVAVVPEQPDAAD